MNVLVMVCGADPRWRVPTVDDQPQRMLEQLTAPEGPDALDPQVSHVVLLTRPTWEPHMQKLATLLRAYDRQRHVAVLPTAHSPLGMAVVAAEINGAPHEPGAAARRAASLLAETDSGWWVRRPGRVDEARPRVTQVLRSWFTKTGYLVSGPRPSTVTQAHAPAWAEAVGSARRLLTSGEVPELQRAHLASHHGGGEAWGRDVSVGGRQLVGRQRAFEWAAPRWDTASRAEAAPDETGACSSCGASLMGYCAYCHARWGATLGERSTAPAFRAPSSVPTSDAPAPAHPALSPLEERA